MSKVEGSKYEELRMQRISENQEKIEALGLSKLVTIFKDRIQKAKKKDKRKANDDDDEDYVPEYEGGLGSKSSSENYVDDRTDEFAATNDLESQKRKVTLEIFSSSSAFSNVFILSYTHFFSFLNSILENGDQFGQS